MTALSVLHRNFIDDRNLGNAPVPLSEYHLLKVRGNKAFDFLQGQLSCDIRQVTDRQGAHGLFCDLKGRIQHIVDVLFWDNDYYLLLPRDLSQDFLKQVRTVAMLSRVELSHASHYSLSGLLKHEPDETLVPLGVQYDPKTNCRHYHMFEGAVLQIQDQQEASLQTELFSLRWQQALLQAKLFRLYPETQGLFLPHRLGLQTGGWIAFDKGCYRGQEIIARTHYRASIKHHLKAVNIQSDAELYPGMELLSNNDKQAMADIIDCMPKSENAPIEALVSLKVDYQNEGLVESHGQAVGMSLM